VSAALVAAVLGAIVGWLLLSVLGATVAMSLPNPVQRLRMRGLPGPGAYGLEAHEVILPDGGPAWWFGGHDPRSAVLVCHGRSRQRRWMLPLVAVLARRWNVCVFDFPGHGIRPWRPCSVGANEAHTVTAALQWLQGAGVERIAVYGVSMGGAAAILSLADQPGIESRVRVLVTDGTFARLEDVARAAVRCLPGSSLLLPWVFALTRRLTGHSPADVRPVDAAGRLQMPVVHLHGDHDWLVPIASSVALREASGGRSRIEVYAGGHDEPGNPAVHAHLVAALEQALGPRSDEHAEGPPTACGETQTRR
jgi:pimeloyl-ACP methyl ester carboxylesterase